MNIGIIVYSKTGNTLSVTQKLEKTIKTAGHTVSIERVEPIDENSSVTELKSAPDITPYEILIFASPVHAFSLAPAMRVYLSQVSDLKGKKVYCFVTQHFKKPWMGGNRAVKQIIKACKAKGTNVIDKGVVNWSGGTRENQIDDIVNRLSSI